MPERKSRLQPAALALTGAAALLRLMPHPPNFTPIGGIALFGGGRLKGWQAYIVPLLAMLITDPILSHMAGYPAFSQATLVIYGSLLLYVVLGRFLIGSSNNPGRIAAASALGSVQFFVITNFFVWQDSGSLYAHNWGGLVECYTAALPFFGRTFVADLFYSAALFTAYALLARNEERNVQHRTI